MKILVTGAAGFIGSYVCKALLNCGNEIVGLDNLNSYYDVKLKHGRLKTLGVGAEYFNWSNFYFSNIYPRFSFIRMNLQDSQEIQTLFKNEKFDIVVNLAAQAGVRYSIENPHTYIDSNIVGFLNILEGCRYNDIKHLVYASSSSVYGLNSKIPFSEKDDAAHPVSIYAATKKTNELMAHAYSHLYCIPTTGLRFFTVYGPWGRPDMSPFLFADAIFHGNTIKIFNNGDMFRDFTYIDDIVEGVLRVINCVPKSNSLWDAKKTDPSNSIAPYKIYNIGNSRPVKLMDFIQAVEKAAGKTAKKSFLPMQPGDVYKTYADITSLENELDFHPNTLIDSGVKETIEWYKEFYKI